MVELLEVVRISKVGHQASAREQLFPPREENHQFTLYKGRVNKVFKLAWNVPVTKHINKVVVFVYFWKEEYGHIVLLRCGFESFRAW